MTRSASSSLLIVIAALALGTVANTVSPTRIPWREDWAHYVANQAAKAGYRLVTLEETRRVIEGGITLVLDARPAPAFGAGHLPGALSVPASEAAQAFLPYTPALDPASPILVYCSGQECDESLQLAEYLGAQGYTNLLVFTDGYAAWAAASGGAP